MGSPGTGAGFWRLLLCQLQTFWQGSRGRGRASRAVKGTWGFREATALPTEMEVFQYFQNWSDCISVNRLNTNNTPGCLGHCVLFPAPVELQEHLKRRLDLSFPSISYRNGSSSTVSLFLFSNLSTCSDPHTHTPRRPVPKSIPQHQHLNVFQVLPKSPDQSFSTSLTHLPQLFPYINLPDNPAKKQT